MRIKTQRPKPEPTIALINIVFFMLIFFMVAGTLATPLDKDLKLVKTQDLEGREPANALVVTAEGAWEFNGQDAADLATYVAEIGPDKVARVVPDRDAPASRVVRLAQELRRAGARRVVIVTEKALK